MTRLFIVVIVLAGLVTSSCGFRRKKYDNPITKDTKQPDKVLFDKSVDDIEHGRYEVARITLNTLINTYDQSEFLAKAKLAIADSWYREGGSHGLAQAEAEYKDFILFYPTMEEAAESQQKICEIHYRQMEKADRDMTQALRAEDECRQLIVQFPNSKFIPETEQLLRNIQEAIGEGEYRVGHFYYKKGHNPAAANRLNRLVDQYPLYSKADEALWELGDAYGKMGTRFRQKAGEAYARIVREYPLSDYVDASRKRLTELELPVPEADPAAYARMKYDQENRKRTGMIMRSAGFLKRGPDMSTAARNGAPAMTTVRPTVPASVPPPPTGGSFTGDVSASTVGDSSTLDNNPDARKNPPSTDGVKAAAADETPQPLPSNYQPPKPGKKKKKGKNQPEAPATAPAATTPATTAPATTTPATTTPPASPPPAQ
jgi:outer membrane protein assembly factor BamD